MDIREISLFYRVAREGTLRRKVLIRLLGENEWANGDILRRSKTDKTSAKFWSKSLPTLWGTLRSEWLEWNRQRRKGQKPCNLFYESPFLIWMWWIATGEFWVGKWHKILEILIESFWLLCEKRLNEGKYKNRETSQRAIPTV